jgi:hypothetical protein
MRETHATGLRFSIDLSHQQDAAMNQNIQHHSNAWVTFTYGSFGASAFLVAIGVYFCRLISGSRAISRWAS